MRWASCPDSSPRPTVGAIVQHEVVYENNSSASYGKRDLRLETFDLPEMQEDESSQRWSLTACASLPGKRPIW